MSDAAAFTGFIPQIAAMERDCFREPWSEKTLEESAESGNRVFSVVSKDGELLGYGIGVAAGDQGEIERLCVRKDARKQGIARSIMNDLKASLYALGAEVIFLEVRSRNVPAVSLYESLGYKKIGTRPKYYIDDDAVIFELRLIP